MNSSTMMTSPSLHHVVLVAVVQVLGSQRRVHVVHQRDVGGVVQARAFGDQTGARQDQFGVLVALLGQVDLSPLLVDGEVAGIDHAFARAHVGFADLQLQHRHDGVDAHVQLGVVFGLAADDQRGARLVDQDGVDLVDDREVQLALHAVGHVGDHVVAQVVEAVLVVGAVGDVGGVGGLLLVALHAGHVDADGQAKERVEPPHPLGVAARQIVVDGDEVHAQPRQRIQVHRQRGHQRLAFAGAHLGDLALMQRDATDELYVEVTHLQRALAAFTHDSESFGQQVVERFALGYAGLELLGLGAQRGVVQLLEARLQCIDLRQGTAVLLEQPVVAAAEDGGKKLHAVEFCVRAERGGRSGTAAITKRWTPGPRDVGTRATGAIGAKRGRKPGRYEADDSSGRRSRPRATRGRSQRLPKRNRAGSCGTPPSSTSKCRCGPVERPELPTSASFWPRLTTSPLRTSTFDVCA